MIHSAISGFPCRQGKVRDVYDLGDRLVIVATDRISAFDWVLPTPVPDKGRVLTALSSFWFDWLKVPNHLLSLDPKQMPAPFAERASELAGRTMLVRKTEVVPFECVVRGYLAGSGWKEYRASQSVCGIKLPLGLQESERLPEPIFTPATKAESGHDENVSFQYMAERIREATAVELRDRSIDIYRRAADHAKSRGLILADTKFEWGRLPTGELILIDEVLTPDSSRYWPMDGYRVGISPPSFDKQFVRDWLETTGWDKASPPPALPAEVVAKTAAKYREAYERVTGQQFK
jgi:phosphoribosylaminoimidazole-succinocarboxamide synthase